MPLLLSSKWQSNYTEKIFLSDVHVNIWNVVRFNQLYCMVSSGPKILYITIGSLRILKQICLTLCSAMCEPMPQLLWVLGHLQPEWWLSVACYIHRTVSWQVKAYSVFLNTLGPRQNGHCFADDILKCIFLKWNFHILIKLYCWGSNWQ